MARRLVTAVAALLLVLGVVGPSFGAVDMFLSIPGYEGGCKEPGFEGWSTAYELQHQITNLSDLTRLPDETLTGEGDSLDLCLLKTIDKASAKLSQACVVGTRLPVATIVHRIPVGGKVGYLTYEMHDVLVSRIVTVGPDHEGEESWLQSLPKGKGGQLLLLKPMKVQWSWGESHPTED